MLRVEIYRSKLSTGGTAPSCELEQITLVNVDGPNMSPSAEALPYILLKEGDVLKIAPAYTNGKTWSPVPSWFAFSGNFAYCADSRFAGACERVFGGYFGGAVRVFDLRV